jgi:hypothetical protein
MRCRAGSPLVRPRRGKHGSVGGKESCDLDERRRRSLPQVREPIDTGVGDPGRGGPGRDPNRPRATVQQRNRTIATGVVPQCPSKRLVELLGVMTLLAGSAEIDLDISQFKPSGHWWRFTISSPWALRSSL